jgi:2-polyprenyl-6-hydroxyphenyl methylase/3-demethylubiquinone-9 3-methyltransferase
MTHTKPVSAPSIDPAEIAYFENLAHRWWDAEGPFWPLHGRQLHADAQEGHRMKSFGP